MTIHDHSAIFLFWSFLDHEGWFEGVAELQYVMDHWRLGVGQRTMHAYTQIPSMYSVDQALWAFSTSLRLVFSQ